MAKFHLHIDEQEIAAQVAHMVNLYNRWATRFTATSIMRSRADYHIEMDGRRVIGCAAIVRDYETLSKIHHICVLPEYRGLGIAKRLTETVIDSSETQLVYMTIREDNVPSLRLAASIGFKYVEKHWFRDHWTLTYGFRAKERRLHDGRERIQKAPRY